MITFKIDEARNPFAMRAEHRQVMNSFLGKIVMQETTLREIAVNSAYQLGFYIVMRRSYNTKEYGYVKGFDEAKISTLVNILRSLLAGCPQFSREVAEWIKKGIEGAK